jgi:hypothetical protein
MSDTVVAAVIGAVVGILGGIAAFLAAFRTRRDEAELAARGVILESLVKQAHVYASAMLRMRHCTSVVLEHCASQVEDGVFERLNAKRHEAQQEVVASSVPWSEALQGLGRELINELNRCVEEANALRVGTAVPGCTPGALKDHVGAVSRTADLFLRDWFEALYKKPSELGKNAQPYDFAPPAWRAKPALAAS